MLLFSLCIKFCNRTAMYVKFTFLSTFLSKIFPNAEERHKKALRLTHLYLSLLTSWLCSQFSHCKYVHWSLCYLLTSSSIRQSVQNGTFLMCLISNISRPSTICTLVLHCSIHSPWRLCVAPFHALLKKRSFMKGKISIAKWSVVFRSLHWVFRVQPHTSRTNKNVAFDFKFPQVLLICFALFYMFHMISLACNLSPALSLCC